MMHFSYFKTSDAASNIGGGRSRPGRGRGTSSSRTETTKYVTFSVYFEHVHAHGRSLVEAKLDSPRAEMFT
jgi:hypothetical protein